MIGLDCAESLEGFDMTICPLGADHQRQLAGQRY